MEDENYGDYDIFVDYLDTTLGNEFNISEQYDGEISEPCNPETSVNCTDRDLMPCCFPNPNDNNPHLTFSVASEDYNQTADMFTMKIDVTFRHDISDMIITGNPAETGTVSELFLDGAPDWFIDADLDDSNLDLIWSREIYFPRPDSKDEGRYYPKK